jgi:hypothetical protein
MAVHTETVEVDARADLSLWVRRGEAGGVTDGVETVLDGVDCVTEHDVVEVTGVRPLSNELRLDVTADVTVRIERAFGSRSAAAREELADGFGVTDVASVDLDT